MRPRFAPPAREREGEKQSGGASGGSGGGSGREREGSKQDDTGRRGGGGGWDDGGIIFVPGDPYSYPSRQRREPKVTFVRSGQLWEVPVSGSKLPTLVPGVPGGGEARQPARSPIWGRLAFVAPPGELRWITAEGRKPRTLIKADWGRIGQPVWSHDDKLVAFVSDRYGNDDIHIIGEKGGKPREISAHPASDYSPAFASNRNWLYFVSERDGRPSLWRIDVNGNPKSLIRITGLPEGDVISVTSSPNTPHLVVCIQGRDRTRQLWLVMPLSRTEPVKISDGRGDDDQPSFSPDGIRVAFRTAERNNHTIIVWDRRTNRAERITDGPDDSHPAFW